MQGDHNKFTASLTSSAIRPTLTRRHIAAVAIGNGLEFYDFLVYAFFSIQIGRALFPMQSAYGSLMLSLATFGAGFVMRPIGAMAIGTYADRVGRRPAMMLCFTLIGGSITLMALIPSYASIGIAAPILAIVARMAQGFSLGGEVGTNSAYLADAAPEAQRGFVLSLRVATELGSLVAGGSVGLAMTLILPANVLEPYGWRIAMLLGAVAVPFGLWLRRTLPETLHAPVSDTAPVSSTSRLSDAIAHRRVMVLSFFILGGWTMANYVFVYINTFAQATLHLPERVGLIAETGGFLCSIPAVIWGGRLSDRFGRWPVNAWGNLLFLVIIYPVFSWIVAAHSAFALITGVVLLNVVSNFTTGAFYAGFAECLPKSIRSSGFGIIYAVSIAMFGGTTQLAVTWLIHVTGSAMAPAWYMIGATAVAQIALILMRESAPIKLAMSPMAARLPT